MIVSTDRVVSFTIGVKAPITVGSHSLAVALNVVLMHGRQAVKRLLDEHGESVDPSGEIRKALAAEWSLPFELRSDESSNRDMPFFARD